MVVGNNGHFVMHDIITGDKLATYNTNITRNKVTPYIVDQRQCYIMYKHIHNQSNVFYKTLLL